MPPLAAVLLPPPAAAAASALPLYVLLATDVGNGCYALATGQPATAAALAVKAAVALALLSRVAWSGAVLAALVVPVLAGAAYLATRGDALLASSIDANLLLAKTAGTTLLLALAASLARDLPPAALARYLRSVLGVVAASLALGLAGIGHDRYGDADALLAANGFMPAGNELNVALVALFWWLSARRHRGSAAALDRRLYWLCLALMVVSGSKAAIASALLIVLWFHARSPLRLLAVVGVALVALRVLAGSSIGARWLFFFGVHVDEGLLSALTGGRFARAADALAAWSALPREGLPFMATTGYVESDPLDLLLNFGWAGAALCAAFAGVLWQACRARWLPWLLVLAASTLAGHVAYSVFAAPVLACALAPARTLRPGWQRWQLRQPAQQPAGGVG